MRLAWETASFRLLPNAVAVGSASERSGASSSRLPGGAVYLADRRGVDRWGYVHRTRTVWDEQYGWRRVAPGQRPDQPRTVLQSPKALALRGFLVAVVRDEGGRLVTYGEVGRTIGHPPNFLTPYLDEVARDCESKGQPDLTMLVVNANSRVPSKFRWRLVENGEIDRDDWMREVERVRRENW